MLKGVSAIDLFCGVGGLTRGLRRAGIPVLAGVDLDASCEFAYEENNKGAQFIAKSITDKNLPDLLEQIYPTDDIRVLVGCAPCQPFSTYTHTNKERDKDAKWYLINEFMRTIKALKPHVVSMENVPRLAQQDIFLDLITELEEQLGYHICAEIVDCADYGVPQHRKRLVMLASRLGPITIVNGIYKDKPKTVGQTIRGLRRINAGEICSKDPLHQARGLSSLNLERIRQSKPGGTWHDWDKRLRAKCHTKASGASYSSVYARMEWNKPAPTITTQFIGFGTGRFGHPNQDRALSLREGALLQTFPKTYQFFPKDIDPSTISADRIAIHIGNAVPFNLGWAIGRSIAGNIKKYR